MDGSHRSEGLIAVVTGARAFCASPDELWAKRQCWHWLRSLDRNAIVFTGGARGPDRWSVAYAHHLGMRTVQYAIDGRRLFNGRPSPDATKRRWTTAAPPDQQTATRQEWKDWCLGRDAVMIDAAMSSVCRGWEARMLALVPGWPRPTAGTEYTAELFKAQFLEEWLDLRTSPTISLAA